ncbi:MAG: 16S rRNA (adenine(1518)-N(6)/adenine(1519)-N(6))-dimethyltransferase RsmA [Acidobacteriota bacterium]
MKPRARKSLGQHFLADPNYCRKLARFAQIGPEDTVVEIGPGTGQLTKVLTTLAQKVIAVEFDSAMVQYLKDHWPDDSSHQKSRLTLIQADILTLDWKTIPGNSLKVIGNLPYNISTRILKRMTEIKDRFQSCTVMVQKEVAERIAAAPASKDYGYFTLLMEYHFLRVKGFNVPPGVFVPKPKVISHALKLIPRKPPYPVPDYESFLALLKDAFQQRRKTLWNNLKHNHDPERLHTALEACEIEAQARPEAVTLKQYACLARML